MSDSFISNAINSTNKSFLTLTCHSNPNNTKTNNTPNSTNTQAQTNNNSLNPNNNINNNSLVFNITKAYIKESLNTLFEIICEGYLENLSTHPFNEFNTKKNSKNINNNKNINNATLNFHPNTLINTYSTFSISNPYPNLNTNTTLFSKDLDIKLDNPSNPLNNPKIYQGIIASVQYLGLNTQSTDNILNRANTTKSLNHKHFFNFSITSPLFRASLNKANRIYNNKTPIEVLQSTIRFYENALGKNIDFSNISFSYPKEELITQYNESDLDFILRIAHNNGIYFYEDSNTIYFYDFMANRLHHSNNTNNSNNNMDNTNQPSSTLNNQSNINNDKSNPNNNHSNIMRHILFNPNPNNTQNTPCIHSLYKSQHLLTKSFTQSTHSSLNPYQLHSLSATFKGNNQSNDDEISNDTTNNNDLLYNAHIYHSHFSFTQDNDLQTPLYLANNRATLLHNTFQAQSNIYDVALNQSFSINLEQSLKDSKESITDFYIIGLEQILINEALLENTINTNDNITKKSNAFFSNFISSHNTINTTQGNTQGLLQTLPNNLDSFNALNTLLGNNNILNNTNIANNNANTKSKSYSNTLTLLPINISFTPSPKAKPLSPSTTLGVVIGSSDDIEQQRNTIHTDEFGRVRVRINCFANQTIIDNELYAHIIQGDNDKSTNDLNNLNQSNNNTTPTNQINTSNNINSTNALSSNNQSNQQLNLNEQLNQSNSNQQLNNQSQSNLNQNSNQSNNQSNQSKLYHYSPYLRVATPIASNQSGLYHTPRIGDEVLISFLDNDIDKPYISGSLYNQSNKPNPHLPKDANQTSLSSKTIGTNENGINEIILHNLKDNELISLHAQKDYEELIHHNFTQTIQHNKDSTTQGIYTEKIDKAHNQFIGLAKSVEIGGEYITNVALSKDTIVGLSNTLNVGASNKLRVANDSSEYVGGDKNVEIGGNVIEEIGGDKTEIIEGDSKNKINKGYELYAENGISLNTQQQFNLSSNNYVVLSSNEDLSLQTKKQLTQTADSSYANIESNCEVNAGNQILHQVGDTSITAKGDSVIIKAGGVEVVIDSNGLVVKGGDIKSE